MTQDATKTASVIDQNGKHVIGICSPDTELLANHIGAMQPGETFTRQKFAEMVGYAMDSATGRSRLASARRIAQREKGVVTVAVPSIGIQRIVGDDIPKDSLHSMRRIPRIARRENSRLNCVDTQALSEEGRRRWVVSKTLCVFHTGASSQKAIAKLEGAAADASHALSLKKTLALFAPEGNGTKE